MNLQYLRYIIQISTSGSINKAAQALYLSQSTLSRALQEVESEAGFRIFDRDAKGIALTHEGEVFIDKAVMLLNAVNNFQEEYFIKKPRKNEGITLLLGLQRSYPGLAAYYLFYGKNCRNAEYLNTVIREGSRADIMDQISSDLLQLGVVHYLSSETSIFRTDCERLNLEIEPITSSKLCVQVSEHHPLADKESVTLDMLSAYPRVAFLDEDASGINYCSDIRQYNTNAIKRRIVVQERGTHREILLNTDGYYIGSYYDIHTDQVTGVRIPITIKCIPISDTSVTIKTVFIYRKGHLLTQAEKNYMREVRNLLK